MCLILDANMYDSYIKRHEDILPVRKWIEGKGKLAYSPTKKFDKELQYGKMEAIFNEYNRAGKTKKFDKKAVQQKTEELKKLKKLKSNDAHIIALALVGKVKLLVSNDQKLHQDFKDKDIVGGSVYQTAKHHKLLKDDTCP